MQKRMIVYLQSIEPLQIHWICVDEHGALIQSSEVDPNTLPTDFKDTKVSVIVPGQDVLLTYANLPKLNPQKLMQALPYALEEQLLDDVDNLHFAVGPYQNETIVPVAIVSKQKMNAWLQALESLSIFPSVLAPSIFTLPHAENTWHINTYDQLCTIRSGKFSGFVCDEANLKTIMDSATQHEPPEVFRSKLVPLQLIETFSETPINLLQNTYRAKPEATQTKKIWQLAGFAAAIWLVLSAINSTISFFILHHQTSQLEASIKKIYQRNFPSATAMTAPKQRMEEKLKKQFAEVNKNNFLGLLAILGKNMADAKGIHLQNLEFREKLLTLEVLADSFDSLDTFTNLLEQQGLSVKRQNATTAGNQVKASLLINAGAA